MNRELLGWLCCPVCRADLTLGVDQEDVRERVVEGWLTCRSCDSTYPIRNHIPRFVASDGDVDNFSYEWRKWSRVQLDGANGTDESERTFAENTGFRPADIRGRLVLDAGCGAGRFLDVVSRWGGRVIGVDCSYAVDAAQATLGVRDHLDLVQADLFRLPFKQEAFDVIFSIGVLHHTADTRGAFLRLPPLLKNGGHLAVWLYHYPDRLYRAASDAWRALFRHVPHRLLFAWCWLLVFVFSDLYRRPFMSRRPWSLLTRILPVNNHSNRQWRVLDTFDWYSPRHQDKLCTSIRVIGWFREAGLKELAVCDPPTAVRGRRTQDVTAPEFVTAPVSIRGKRLLIFGAGAGGRQAIEQLEQRGAGNHVAAVCDSDPSKWGTLLEGHIVCPFEQVSRDDYDIAIVASRPGRSAIAARLTREGLAEYRDFATASFVTDFSMAIEEVPESPTAS
jgi:SAM-dependent methyltransferase